MPADAPIGVFDRNWPSHVMRASLAFYFPIIMSMSVVGYGLSGLYTARRIALILIVAVPMLARFGLSGLLLSRLNERSLRRCVTGVIMLTSIMVLTRELWRI